MHGNLLFEPKLLEPGLIMQPEMAAATANEGMVPKLCGSSGKAVARRIIPAAIERPIVDAELTPNQARRLRSLGAAK